MVHDFWDTPVEFCKGVGPARSELLKKELNIFTIGDLLLHYPFRYIDKTVFYKVNDISENLHYVQVKGIIRSVAMAGTGRSARLVACLADETGEMELVWFNGVKWMKDKVVVGQKFVVFGKPTYFNGKLNITHPEIEPLTEEFAREEKRRFYPVYSSTEKLKSKGLDSKGISKIVLKALEDARGRIADNLPYDMLNRLKLVSREEAIFNIHYPADQPAINRATARLKFEELFFIQLRLVKTKFYRNKKIPGLVFQNVGKYLNDFYHLVLPYELTGAQKRVVREIRKDLGSGKQMNRLLQGDVGSGKTVVALMSMLIALDNGFQACIMAPTEILSVQHYNTIKNFCSKLDIKVSLLTGSTKSAERKKILESLLNGETRILLGTHALIEEVVRFQNLGLAVIDEQHRFGVAQRAKLWEKSDRPPHILVMTATPIPRTLAMTLYGDLDVSVIDELPPGRKAIKTLHFGDSNRLKVFAFLKEQIKQGRQVYIVYPLIHESETLDLKHLMEGYDAVVRDFPLPEYAVSMVHGKMKPKEKEYEMARFVKGETQIMVATTVIEVGVDVPNASVMLIENSERFGLSQLHQLRGRVGRGADQSFCLLMTSDKLTSDARQRIKAMLETSDGFRIAELDLKLRGPGNIEGLEQSGITDLHIADLVADEKILKYARNEAFALLEADPELESPANAAVRQFIVRENKRKGSWGMIS
ncbi:MAG TPA: ATP-dependent DNA helicase RecG [Bacteroidales bacterium]|nr:ATP-dependent DNA helicase RecG [Bacteroidales bacterium]HPB24379.1 ATP-dependent DNA helicase RecG [Bacteroidales bacterium]HPI30943.1 ATP-dependent DNA helicase RecG [Bacteroidales bacterium]HQN15016.1 ATP-dependent DNA helicase RecG [Bacteroidales bacterium]HQP15925.1 ATP-dependent DNA helicase RecG [Bacteroidales bacterium]